MTIQIVLMNREKNVQVVRHDDALFKALLKAVDKNNVNELAYNYDEHEEHIVVTKRNKGEDNGIPDDFEIVIYMSANGKDGNITHVTDNVKKSKGDKGEVVTMQTVSTDRRNYSWMDKDEIARIVDFHNRLVNNIIRREGEDNLDDPLKNWSKLANETIPEYIEELLKSRGFKIDAEFHKELEGEGPFEVDADRYRGYF